MTHQPVRALRIAVALAGILAALSSARLTGQRTASPPSAPPRSTALTAATPQAAPAARATHAAAAAANRALLDRYCVTCHNDRVKTANLSLQGLDLARSATTPSCGRRSSASCAPASCRRPTCRGRRWPSTRGCATGSRWRSIDGRRQSDARRGRAAPAESHRVRQRHPRSARPADRRDALLPPDDSANGFDNIAGSLTISPTLLESYATAAARVARMAVGYWKTPTEATYLASERRVAEPSPRGHAVRHPRRHRGAPRFSGRRRVQVLDSELRHRQLHPRRAAGAHHRRRARARLAVSRRRRRGRG